MGEEKGGEGEEFGGSSGVIGEEGKGGRAERGWGSWEKEREKRKEWEGT